MFASWFNFAMLASESQQAIILRTMRLAAGGAGARRETQRMICEKIFAGAHAAQQLALGAPPESILAGYRKKVRANVRRLSRKRRRR